jgi:hypothetical protein
MAIRSWRAGIATRIVVLVCFSAGAWAPFVEGQAKDRSESYPSRILLIRHAEKPADETSSVHLTPEGMKRAEQLFHLFEASEKRTIAFPVPDFIFAAKDSKHSHRPVETVAVLAKKLKLPINANYRNEDFTELVQEIFHSPKYAGKTILICWHHGTLPQLANRLKAANAPETWKGTVFDRLWEITYDGKGKTTFRDLPQHLLSSDTEK